MKKRKFWKIAKELELVNAENISLEMIKQQHFKLRMKYKGKNDKIKMVNEAFEKLKKFYF